MPPRLVKKFARVLLHDKSARIVAVADTHSRPHPAMVERLVALEPSAILHAGDVGEATVLDELAKIAPLFAVRGNIDKRTPALPDVLTLEFEGDERTLRILLLHIAVQGPRLRADVARMARKESASLIVCGHSHVPFIGQDHELTVFNPGSIGPRRFHLPIVFGTIDVTAEGARLAHIDCETGRPWTPP